MSLALRRILGVAGGHEDLQLPASPKRGGEQAPSARADPRASGSQESVQTSGGAEGVHAVHGPPLAADLDLKFVVRKDPVGGAAVAHDARPVVG